MEQLYNLNGRIIGNLNGFSLSYLKLVWRLFDEIREVLT